jgi:anti-sigma-K factor RskA
VSARGDEHSWEQQLPAYALGALDGEEARVLEAHLGECERCRERLRWLQPAVDVIPASVEQLQPRPELKAALMEAVRGESAETSESRRPWWRGARMVSLRPALALAVAGLVAAGAIGYALNTNGSDEGTTTVERTLVEAVPSGNVRAAATLEVGKGGAVLNVERLPRLGSEDDYQAWVQVDGEFVPSGTFEVADDRGATAVIGELPAGAEAVLVTREPNGGSEQPSTEPLLTAKLS